MTTSYDAVVVGAGPNGLTAAAELARAGRSVLVVEARETIGGGARSAALTLPGFVHDVCSAIHPTAVVSPALAALPLAEHGVEWAYPEAALAHPLDDGSAAVLERTTAATGASFGEAADARAWARLFDPLAAQAPALFRALLAPPLRPPARPLLMARFGLVGLRGAAQVAGGRFAGPRARALFAGCAAHSFIPLDHAGSAAFGLVLGTAAHAIGWPCAKGGSQKIPDALAAIVRAAGGVIETGRLVGSLAELPRARAYLFDVAPSALARIARDRLPPGYRARLERFRHGPGAFKIDYALGGPVPWTAPACARAGTVHLGGTLEEIALAEAACWRGEVPERPFVLVAQQSVFDPSRAPAGKHTLWAYAHAPNGCTVDLTAAIERQLERFAPGFRDRVLARHVTSAAALERYNPNLVGGDIAGGANDLGQVLARPLLRWTPSATPAPDLFLCSSSTPPGGGVHGMCGHFAAQAALRSVLR